MPAAAPATTSTPSVHVVPHTHWDREWYLPFAVYRRRLVGLVDTLLRTLREEPRFRFHLDGQMAVVDDYLELRPWRAGELRSAAETGRVSLGPWYTLPDEHLVSGESLLRNLELGIERARDFAPGTEPMLVGYVPDQFGHAAQLPQLLRRFGIDVAVLWRGVPASVTSSVFTWEGLDGSEVEVVHMRRGYGHGREMPVAGAELVERLREEVDWQRDSNPEGPWLVMTGDDHLPVPVGLSLGIEEAALVDPAALSSVAAYARARPPAHGRVRGELHSAASSFVLKGTLSARFPLKLRHAALERRLERYVEPAWTLSGRPWPDRRLRYAWRQLILNSAHDSICGCSIDQVHEQATARLERAETAAQALWEGLGAAGGRVLFNPSPFPRRGIPALGVGEPENDPSGEVGVASLGLELEDVADRGDEYTFDPPPGARAVRRPLAGATATRQPEGHVELRLTVDNRTPDHRLRLVVPCDTAAGCWAGVSFGAVARANRRPGSEPGVEYDLRTDPARGWVFAGGRAVAMAGPFEYELLPDGVAITLLRSVGWLSRPDLEHRPGPAGPTLATPGAQMLGEHSYTVALGHAERWQDAARLYEVFAHPLVPAPAAPLAGFEPPGEGRVLSALRRVGPRAQLRTWSTESFRIEDRWLD
jgi:alpha-mannosidase